MRKETEEDRRRQEAARLLLQAAWDCTIEHNPREFTEIDWCLMRNNRVHAFIEIKGKLASESFGTYPFVLVDLHKWSALHDAHVLTGLPAWIIVQYPEGLYWTEVYGLQRNVLLCGRTDRGSEEKGPAIGVPLDRWKSIDIPPAKVTRDD